MKNTPLAALSTIALAAAAVAIWVASGCGTTPANPDWTAPMPVEDAHRAAQREYKKHPPRYAAEIQGTTITVVGKILEFPDPETALIVTPGNNWRRAQCRTGDPELLTDFDVNQRVIATGTIKVPQQWGLPLEGCQVQAAPMPPAATPR